MHTLVIMICLKTQTSIKSCDQFLELVMARIKAEELYSKNLAKVALMGFEYIEGSSVQISFDQFKVNNIFIYLEFQSNAYSISRIQIIKLYNIVF